jgi:hypothetical protein
MNMTNAKGAIKKHAFEITCGGIAVVALAVCYVGIPFVWGGFPAVSAELSEEAHKRIKDKNSIVSILKEAPSLEGVRRGSLVSDADYTKITFTDPLGKLREEANNLMQKVKSDVMREAALNNRDRRVKISGEGTDRAQVFALFFDEDLEYKLKIPAGQSLLKSKGKAAARNTYDFVDVYNNAFVKLTNQLTGSPQDNLLFGVVPDIATFTKAFDDEKKRIEDAEPAAFKRATVPGAANPAATAADIAAKDGYVKNAVMALANRTQMYVDPRTAFQRRTLSVPPSSNDIWESYVDIWLQRDVVDAIVKTNNGSQNKAIGVGKSLVPRLLSIRVGPETKKDFLPTATVSPMLGNKDGAVGGGIVQAPAGEGKGPMGLFEPTMGPNEKFDNLQSMTGRRGDDQYYVVMMSVSVIIEPSAVNTFINNLYDRNNGYTVVNRRDTAVDPYAAAGAGYLYGNRQCIQLDLLVECLMFRSWVDQVIPTQDAN